MWRRYDFALPLLVLHAFEFKSTANLKHWLSVCPRRQITVLDTHDGMGIDDITGLANVCDVEELKDTVTTRLGCDPNYKYFYDSDEDIYNASPHQYNCTYYSALEGNPRHYLMARAIQFWTPGIPMVYYVGLLAGRNDHKVRHPLHTFDRADPGLLVGEFACVSIVWPRSL
jgi:sucrose phosphorylase